MKTTRPRGNAPYSPREDALQIITAIKATLNLYQQQLPLSMRQIYYRLVSDGLLDKTESDYSKLCNISNRARRAELLNWSDIRDDGFIERVPAITADINDFKQTCINYAETLTVDRQQGQDRRLVLWCETAGMVPQLVSIAEPYGIPVYSSGGFDGVSQKQRLGVSFANQGPITVLHIGDLDPSGEHMYSSLQEDITAFCNDAGGDITFARIAVTREQVTEYALPTAPPKKTDNRSFTGLTTQCEALKPNDLAQIVTDEIQARMDTPTYYTCITREHALRDEALNLITND